jgi:hypothetical protein
MKRSIVVLALVFGACSSEPAKPAEKPAEKPAMKSLEASLYYTSEGIYEKIVIDGPGLKYTYNKPSKVDPGPMSGAPLWTEKDLVTVSADLTDAEVADLRSTIESSKFLSLDARYGAKERERAYPTTIRVKLGADEKQSVYFAGMGTPPPPDGFTAVADKLRALVKAKKLGNN